MALLVTGRKREIKAERGNNNLPSKYSSPQGRPILAVVHLPKWKRGSAWSDPLRFCCRHHLHRSSWCSLRTEEWPSQESCKKSQSVIPRCKIQTLDVLSNHLFYIGLNAEDCWVLGEELTFKQLIWIAGSWEICLYANLKAKDWPLVGWVNIERNCRLSGQERKQSSVIASLSFIISEVLREAANHQITL